ncbi:NTP transferase domain-containing protein [Clostridium omnivorum]|uniref:MobA-like NTP transferase domain-containing protein n=1 Tax=Clostridium omnivorum TaxID=1604902 RepID=A0ABQ5N3R5_9CLOT|nr:NTP transferase domain-containing protein [Clostridium sp. E14]GLC29695.1 hypothetical protein bsdE14_11050 [Clostridium sp. E14]
MLEKELKVLEIINKRSKISQREIAVEAEISIGKSNSIIKYLLEKDYIRVEKNARKSSYLLNEKALEALEEYIKGAANMKMLVSQQVEKKINYAVILAAGERSEFEKPIGFLPLGEINVIERLLYQLKECAIENIIIVTGYESHYYEKLAKNNDVQLVHNEAYRWTGTMASLSKAKEFIKDDFLLIEGDMVFENRAIREVLNNKNRDCALITTSSGSGDEVFVELKNGFLYKLSKDIHQFNRVDGEMIGITKLSIDIYNKMLEEFKHNENPYLNYEYLLLDMARTYNIGYVKIEDLVWSEIDTKWHYNNLINYIYPKIYDK